MPASVVASACLVLSAAWSSAAADAPSPDKGTVQFKPVGDQKDMPQRYRLAARSFDFEMEWKADLPICDAALYTLKFPSAVESPHVENNTVYAEYYRPSGDGPFPAVIVLDITGGDQSISRLIGMHLARHRIAGLFVQMAYYGPRRPPGSNLRLVSTDLVQTMDAIRQTVLDLRLAAAWMESRPELDAKRLGILGTSLGSFMAALTSEMEPKLGRVALLLGGGGLVDGYYDHPKAAPYRKVFESLGGTKEMIARAIAPVDPITRADRLKDRKLLMLAGKRDDIVPPSMAQALWEASGKQKIVWYDCTHYGAAVYYADAMEEVVAHFGGE
jgi:dienelactone hydrolase